MNVEEQMYKTCTKCFDDKPYKMFYNCTRNIERKSSWCKECQKNYSKCYKNKKKVQAQKTLKYFDELPFNID